jgi:hypothetical protein
MAMARVPFRFDCSKDAGFVMGPNVQKRVGYVTALQLLSAEAALSTDLRVSVPFDPGAAPGAPGATRPAGGAPVTAEVVGVIEKFEWAGGAGDSLQFEFYVSQRNAVTIKSRQQVPSLPTGTKVTKLDWWIADFDHETKEWFRQSYPERGAVSGTLAGKETPLLDVDLNPVVAIEGIDVNVYKVSMMVDPAAQSQYSLHFANSSTQKTVKTWGLVVGTEQALT